MAKTSRITVVRAEAVEGETALTLTNADAVGRVVGAAGVVFIDAGELGSGDGRGVRLRQVLGPR